MVKVKVCGITNLRDARRAIACGSAALGFVFYKKSSRYISPRKARGIIKKLPRAILKVGVFVDSPQKEVEAIASGCGLDMLQLHGAESPEFCGKLKGYKIIKAFRIKKRIANKELARYKTYAYLFDSYNKRMMGGTGRVFPWGLLRGRDKIKKPIFLAGGLTGQNVAEAVKRVRPQWVDVSSSVEARPGKKDYNKIKAFMKALRQEA